MSNKLDLRLVMKLKALGVWPTICTVVFRLFIVTEVKNASNRYEPSFGAVHEPTLVVLTGIIAPDIAFFVPDFDGLPSALK